MNINDQDILNAAPEDLIYDLKAIEEVLVERARVDPEVFCAYVLKHETTGAPIVMQPMHKEWHQLITENKRTLIWAHVEAGKALALDTPIFTRDGWSTIGTVAVGATVFDRRGYPCRVTAKSRVFTDHVCYRVRFTDGDEVVADADHRWAVAASNARKKCADTQVLTTQELVDRPMVRGKWAVPTGGPIQMPAWHDERARYQDSTNEAYEAGRLFAKTKKADSPFITGSIEQRFSFLAGVLDVRGLCCEAGCIVVTSTSLEFCQTVAGLYWSLGIKCSVPRRYKREGKLTWRVGCRPHVPVFRNVQRLERQALNRVTLRDRKKAAWRTIESITRVDTVPTQCLTVDSPDHTFRAGQSHFVTHNSNQLAIGRVLFELGRNPSIRVCILQNVDEQAKKTCAAIARYILSSPELHKVFPHLRPDKNLPWTSHQLNVERATRSKDPSVRTSGVHGNILGSRIDLLIVDDILDYENTLSQRMRDDVANWFKSTVETRLTKNAKIISVGTAWHKDDLLHRWAKTPGWMAVRYPVIDGDVLTWPENWPLERIHEVKERLGPVEYARSLLCLTRTDDESRFREDWIKACLARGEGIRPKYSIDTLLPGYRTYTGVDLGVRVRDGSDVTAIFTILVHPDESREVVDCTSGNWTGPEIVEKIFDVHNRYQSTIMVENNAAQQFILDFCHRKSAIPVIPFTTTGSAKKNHDFGLESIATEMSIKKWIIPSRFGVPVSSELATWISEMLFYDPLAHPGDRLMASWMAREAARHKKPVARVGKLVTLTR